MENLTREQADELAQGLADETGQAHIIFQEGEWYRVVSVLGDVDVVISDTVDCKWPGEGV